MFPVGKRVLVVKTCGLPSVSKDKTKIFEFRVMIQDGLFNMIIPGTHRGYDLIDAESELQEDWLWEIEKNFEGGFKKIWYCQWQIDDEESLNKFLRIIESNIIEKKFLS